MISNKHTLPPDFIIIGAMRAGTTAFAEQLAIHPEIAMSRLKETDYFIEEKNFGRGPQWYSSLFPKNKQITGEASPNYTKNDVFKDVPGRIYAQRPDAKLIYIVRDPVKRFWSQYQHTSLMRGGLPDPDHLLNDDEGAHILAASMYFRQLSDYFELFDRSQIKIIDFDNYINEAAPALDEICRFIGAREGIIATQDNAVNSTQSLAQTPEWLLKLSQNPALADIRARTPLGMRHFFKTLAGKTKPRNGIAPAISSNITQRIGDALRADVEKFRTLTGQSFPHWSI